MKTAPLYNQKFYTAESLSAASFYQFDCIKKVCHHSSIELQQTVCHNLKATIAINTAVSTKIGSNTCLKQNQINHPKLLSSQRLPLMASVVMVAFDRLIFADLTPRTGRDNCGFRNCSGRGPRRFSGLGRSHDRMSSVATGGNECQPSLGKIN